METIEYNVAEQLLVICDEGAYIKGINFPVLESTIFDYFS
jgi:hypothetical protein